MNAQQLAAHLLHILPDLSRDKINAETLVTNLLVNFAQEETANAKLFREQLATLLAQYMNWEAAKDGDVFLLHQVEALQRQNEAMREALGRLAGRDDIAFESIDSDIAENIREARKALSPTAGSNLVPHPKIICICGSTRFVGEMAVEAWKLEKQGVMVLGPHLLPSWYEGVQDSHQAEAEGVAHILDELHLRKIDLADEVFVVNCAIPGHENGYIGERTRAEIAYAKDHNKPITYLI